MRYQNIQAFEKHLDQAATVCLAPVFLNISACAYERRMLADRVVSAICLKEGKIDFSMRDSGIKELIQDLETLSFIPGKRVIYLDNLDKLKKQEIDLLTQYVARPSYFAYLILGASSPKSLAALVALAKKELVVCDISGEKPWERKDRYKAICLKRAVEEKKMLQIDAVEYLIEAVGPNLPSLVAEVEKLITYVGERQEIRLADAKLLCTAKKSLTSWQLADEIVWKNSPPSLDKSDEMLFSLLPQLYRELQQGFLLSLLLEKGVVIQELSHYFPDVRPAALEKMLPVVKQLGSDFFKTALTTLFDMELRAKNSGSDPGELMELLVTKLLFLKKNVQKNTISFS